MNFFECRNKSKLEKYFSDFFSIIEKFQLWLTYTVEFFRMSKKINSLKFDVLGADFFRIVMEMKEIFRIFEGIFSTAIFGVEIFQSKIL